MTDFSIMPAEFVGIVNTREDGILKIGEGEKAVELNLCREKADWIPSASGVWSNVEVYVRRSSSDLSIIEIHMARHDGLAQEALDAENEEAERYPLGPKEYWRAKMVGKYTYGLDNHLMTDEEFEEDWGDEDFISESFSEDKDEVIRQRKQWEMETFGYHLPDPEQEND